MLTVILTKEEQAKKAKISKRRVNCGNETVATALPRCPEFPGITGASIHSAWMHLIFQL